jgi:hypothetical protein
MTSYAPDSLSNFSNDANRILANFLLAKQEEFDAYAKVMADALHGRGGDMVSPPNEVVATYATDRYDRLIQKLER